MRWTLENADDGDSAAGLVRRRFKLRAHATLAGFILLGLTSLGQAAPGFEDSFANRQSFSGKSGKLDGSNVAATFESGEPKHGGKIGGHSVWITWIAPVNGIATFRTDGSTFDTLLSAYTLSPPDNAVNKLHEVARNDDAPGLEPASLIELGVLAGRAYEIAIDGFKGAVGDIRLRWDTIDASDPPPIIVNTPIDQAGASNSIVTLSYALQSAGHINLNWRLNGEDAGVEGDTLVISSLNDTNVGRYTLRIRANGIPAFETPPVEIQINTEGQTNALARDKFFDALSSPLEGKDGRGNEGGPAGGGLRLAGLAGTGVVRGYNGSQIFNTTFATTDPNEPQHCNLSSGASYWLSYLPPTNGTVTLDTAGSTFDTVLAVYTYNGVPKSYADLIPVTCDNDSFVSQSPGAARVQFAAIKARQYAIVVSGVNGTKGVAHLHYALDENQPPIPPKLIRPPSIRTVRPGIDIILAPDVTGSPPLYFRWQKGTNILWGETNVDLRISNSNPGMSGDYSLTVSNLVGDPVVALVPLHVVSPPQLQTYSRPDGVVLSFDLVTGQSYFLEATRALDEPWQLWRDSFTGTNALIVISNSGPAHISQLYFRLRVE